MTDEHEVGLDPSRVVIEHIELERLRHNAWNPNEMDNESFDRLVSELGEVGMIDPIQVVPLEDGTFRILGGAHRFEAAKVLGWDVIPCVILSDAKWEDEDLQKFVTVRLNVLHGRLNPEKMIGLYREMENKYGEDALKGLFAFTDKDAWDKITKQIAKGLKSAGLPQGALDKFKDATKEVKSVEDLSTILNHLFNKYGDSLRYSFMVFAYGGQEHLYVAMNKRMKKAMDKVTTHCREWSKDLNDVVAELTEIWVDETDAKEKEALEAESSADDVVVTDAVKLDASSPVS